MAGVVVVVEWQVVGLRQVIPNYLISMHFKAGRDPMLTLPFPH